MSTAHSQTPPRRPATADRASAPNAAVPEDARRLSLARRGLILTLVASAGCIAGVMAAELTVTSAEVNALAITCLVVAAASLAGLYLIHVRERAAREARADEHLAHGIERLEDLKWELSENEMRYRSLLDSQQEIIVRRDAEGRIVFANRSFCRLLGADPETVVGQKLALEVIDGEVPAPIAPEPAVRRHYAQQIATASGARWIEWEEQQLACREAGELEVQAVGRDVTESRKAEADLAEARDAAEAASRAKSRFLASMSHEIRTPMNGILGMSALLLDMPQAPEPRTYVQAIDQSARTLLALIDEILDFSKIEAGKLVLQEAPFSLETCVQGCVELMAPRAHAKGLDIAWSCDPAIPRLLGDDARVRQILLNLISNAIKFTDTGGVRVAVAAGDARNDGLAGVRICVEDTGIGLADDETTALFGEFAQAETALKRQQGGTGLGLAISKRLARAMEGDITVASRHGRGSTFTVAAALRRALPATAGAQPKSCHDAGRHVLLAFDRPLERRALADQLAYAGVGTTQTPLVDALAMVERSAALGQRFSHVVVDAEGDLDVAGQLAQKVREAGDGDLRGLVLVSTLSRSNLAGFRSYGYETYLVRPVRPSAVNELVCAPGAAPAAAAAAPAAAVDARGAGGAACRVLLAEDNEINALLARRVVERSGGEVTWVANGREAVEAMRAVATGEAAPYDLVLMDIFMPEVDGLEATKQIKAMHERQAGAPCPPIVALTANAFAEDRARYLAAGLDAYLAKPFDKADLEALLIRLARLRRTGDHEAAPSAA